MKFSVIIAVKAFNPYLKECLAHCLEMTYDDFEVIIVPDYAFTLDDRRLKVHPSGPFRPPAKKRDLGAEIAKGEILAFIDDDAYPSKDWLTHALEAFREDRVGAVGGPAVTPPGEELHRQASGLIYESWLVSGHFRYRYVKDTKRYVDDLPSCNLLVRRDLFEHIGGFKTNFWPGEDTLLCLEIIGQQMKIVYDPEVLVYHHRRPIFRPHLQQIKNYALHRGYFVKRYPQTSLRWSYFMPTLFVLWLFLGSLAPILWPLYLFLLLLYASVLAVNIYHIKDMKLAMLVFCGIAASHFTYGIYFLGGLFKSKLEDEV